MLVAEKRSLSKAEPAPARYSFPELGKHYDVSWIDKGAIFYSARKAAADLCSKYEAGGELMDIPQTTYNPASSVEIRGVIYKSTNILCAR